MILFVKYRGKIVEDRLKIADEYLYNVQGLVFKTQHKKVRKYNCVTNKRFKGVMSVDYVAQDVYEIAKIWKLRSML